MIHSSPRSGPCWKIAELSESLRVKKEREEASRSAAANGQSADRLESYVAKSLGSTRSGRWHVKASV